MNQLKQITGILVFAILLAFTSCTKNERSTTKPVEPTFNSNIPSFPDLSLHLVQREYQKKSSSRSESMTFEEYLEQRLIELYPEKAYEGMLDESQEEMKKFEADYQVYLDQLQTYEEENNLESTFTGEDPAPEFINSEIEFDFLDMTKEEISEYNSLEALLEGDTISRDDLDSLLGQGDSRFIVEAALITAAVVSGYSIWRVRLAKRRAEAKTAEFYPGGLAGSGRKGDAFRHCYVSMLLRKYLSRPGASIVMTTYEIIKPNDYPMDTYMDYHNNKVGRHTRYKVFDGGDKKWEDWAINTKIWINTTNSKVKKSWTTSTSKSTVKSQEKAVSDYSYIYYLN